MPCPTLSASWGDMESTPIIDTAAERLAAGFQRARKLWGPFHVVWADLDGRVHWAEPDWCPSSEVALTPFASRVADARLILDELERRAPAEAAGRRSSGARR